MKVSERTRNWDQEGTSPVYHTLWATSNISLLVITTKTLHCIYSRNREPWTFLTAHSFIICLNHGVIKVVWPGYTPLFFQAVLLHMSVPCASFLWCSGHTGKHFNPVTITVISKLHETCSSAFFQHTDEAVVLLNQRANKNVKTELAHTLKSMKKQTKGLDYHRKTEARATHTMNFPYP